MNSFMCIGGKHFLSDDLVDCNVSKMKRFRTDSNLGLINKVTVPSLESIGIVKLVGSLWGDADFRKEVLNFFPDIRCDLDGYYDIYETKDFLTVSDKLSEMLALSPLPNLIKEKAKNYIRPIGLEIFKWISYFEIEKTTRTRNNIKMQEHIDSVSLTINGTVNTVETLKLLFGKIDKRHMFNKACEYCLDEHIADLWKQLPKEVQENSFYTYHIFQREECHLIAYWVCWVKKEMYLLRVMFKSSGRFGSSMYKYNHNVYTNMVTLAISEGNFIAAKYFWNKLTYAEIDTNIVEWTNLACYKAAVCNIDEYSDFVWYLFSKINEEQKTKIFKKYSVVIILALFADWPNKKHFLPLMQPFWDYFEVKSYYSLLGRIIEEYATAGRIGQKMLFKSLWCNSPITYKEYFFWRLHHYSANVCRDLFKIEDNVEILRLIFNDANLKQKTEIFSHLVELEVFYELILTENILSLDLITEECLQTDDEIKQFKQSLMLKYRDDICCAWIENDNCQALEKMFNWGFDSQDKIDTLKADMVNTIKTSSSFGLLCQKGTWNSFESFMKWCLNSDEEMNQFKQDIQNCDKLESFIFNTLKDNCRLDFCHDFLIWFFPSKNEVIQFKKKIMLSDGGVDKFYRAYNYNTLFIPEKNDYLKFVELLGEWFYPTEREEKEMLIEFRKEIARLFNKCRKI